MDTGSEKLSEPGDIKISSFEFSITWKANLPIVKSIKKMIIKGIMRL